MRMKIVKIQRIMCNYQIEEAVHLLIIKLLYKASTKTDEAFVYVDTLTFNVLIKSNFSKI